MKRFFKTKETEQIIIRRVNTPQERALINACKQSDLLNIRKILSENCDPNTVFEYDNVNHTPLHISIQNRHSEGVHELLKYKANVNAYDLEHYTPFTLAITLNRVGFVELFMQHNADPNLLDEGGNNALQIASFFNDNQCFKKLLPLTIINHQNLYGNTALHMAACYKIKAKSVILLLEANFDPNLKNNDSQTPFSLFLDNQEISEEVAQSFIDAKADPLIPVKSKSHIKAKFGSNCLKQIVHFAQKGNKPFIELLKHEEYQQEALKRNYIKAAALSNLFDVREDETYSFPIKSANMMGCAGDEAEE